MSVSIVGGTVQASAALATNAQTGTTYTFVLNDANNTVVELSNASAITATIPLNSSVAFPTGSQIQLLQTGAGQVNVAVTAGVTLNVSPSAGTNAGKLRAQWSFATLIKRGTDTWVLVGDVTA
jgi:hypothetical protein